MGLCGPMTRESNFPNAETRALLDTYFAGEATLAERARAQAYLAEHPLEVELRQSARRVLDVPDRKEARGLDRAVAALRERVRDPEKGGMIQLGQRAVPSHTRMALPGLGGRTLLLACMLVLVVIGIAGQWRTRDTSQNGTIHYATAYGQRSAIVLPDGSRAILAPNTRLSYSLGPNGARTLSLIGQVQFTVTHDANRHFRVRAGGVEAMVLGTTFDIRHYAGDSVVHVAVVSGKISVRGRGTPVLLVAGTESQVTDSTALIVTDRNLEANESWTQGRMVFTNVPVSAVLQTLHRWYGYNFRLADTSLASREVTTMLSVDDTATTLTALRELLRVTMRFDGSTITLYAIKRSQNTGQGTHHRWPSTLLPQAEVGK